MNRQEMLKDLQKQRHLLAMLAAQMGQVSWTFQAQVNKVETRINKLLERK